MEMKRQDDQFTKDYVKMWQRIFAYEHREIRKLAKKYPSLSEQLKKEIPSIFKTSKRGRKPIRLSAGNSELLRELLLLTKKRLKEINTYYRKKLANSKDYSSKGKDKAIVQTRKWLQQYQIPFTGKREWDIISNALKNPSANNSKSTNRFPTAKVAIELTITAPGINPLFYTTLKTRLLNRRLFTSPPRTAA